jgi:acyl-CoA synthetase (NDP forming)
MHFSTETIDQITGIFETAYLAGRNVLYEYEVYEVLKAAGLHTPAYAWIDDPDKISGSVLKQFRDKAVLKVVSPGIAHKQKIGGVKILKEVSAGSLKKSIADMEKEISSHFKAEEKPDIRGYLLVEFIPFDQSLGNEVLFGMKNDHAFGPVLTLSKGGDDKPLVSSGEFRGYGVFGNETAISIKLDHSHGDEEGHMRFVPFHAVLVIDVLNLAPADEKKKQESEESRVYYR